MDIKPFFFLAAAESPADVWVETFVEVKVESEGVEEGEADGFDALGLGFGTWPPVPYLD